MRQAWEAVFVQWMPYTHNTDVVELFLLGYDAFTDHNVVIDQAQYVSD